MGQAEKDTGKVVSFSTFVEVNEDDQTIKMNDHLMDMVLLVSENDRNFKNKLLNALEEL